MRQGGVFDELFGEGSQPRPEFAPLGHWISTTPLDELRQRQGSAERTFRQIGITFAVYGEEEAAERIIPFDLIPRIFAADE